MLFGDEGFVDYYALLGCSPDASGSELKKTYYDLLRVYHPDKRVESPTNRGHAMTQSLNKAWETLQDPDTREAYDRVWYGRRMGRDFVSERATQHDLQKHAENVRTCTVCPQVATAKVAMLRMREGDMLYNAATRNPHSPKVREAHRAAIGKFSAGLALAPRDDALLTRRACCYFALGQWLECTKDATNALAIQPLNKDAWILKIRAVKHTTSASAAWATLQEALRVLPSCPEILALKLKLQETQKVEQDDVEREQREAVPETPKLKLPKLPTEWATSPCASSSVESPSHDCAQNAFGMSSSPGHKVDSNFDCCTCDFVRKEFGLPNDSGLGFCSFCRMLKTSFLNQKTELARKTRDARAETSPALDIDALLSSTWSLASPSPKKSQPRGLLARSLSCSMLLRQPASAFISAGRQECHATSPHHQRRRARGTRSVVRTACG
jgi:curved DNA-binding protein CbpA